jgi:hypothetical protein
LDLRKQGRSTLWFEHDCVRANLLPGRMRAGLQPLRNNWSEPENLRCGPMLWIFFRLIRRGFGQRRWGGLYTPQPPGCVYLNKNTTAVWRAIRRCVKALSASAQRFGCSLEDATGRAEDQRTGLSCPARQAALASQCEARCWTFAVHQNNCESEDVLWQGVFGDIGGFSYGSARVDLCGPRLRSSFLNRTALQPTTPQALNDVCFSPESDMCSATRHVR